ncbi:MULTISPECIES: hypothetical protein [Acinetobacter]|uniref:Uncharacterized protein n=1 Tax=Acinetobacter higginsii TaxID=70347 RepID=N9T449_9GAMM|nr:MULTISPECIES: hypothetical protein [Acinetobacter]ENX58135.1 hypothetical protein F902_02535 [Acinetobacter higginsii]
MIIEDMKKDLNKFIKEHPFVFFGLLVYLGGLAIYCFGFAEINPLSLNEVGDFLAGVFSPLAFLFLYMGYRQNSKSLQIQAEELRQSTEALQLQVREMQASVAEQKVMTELVKTELEEKHNAVKPILTAICLIEVNPVPGQTLFRLEIKLENISANDARSLKVSIDDTLCKSFELLHGKEYKEIFLPLSQEKFKKYRSCLDFDYIISIEFENVLGKALKQGYLFTCSFENGKKHCQTIKGF